MWRQRDRQALSVLLNDAIAQATASARVGHSAIAQQLETNKGVLLEQMHQIDGKVSEVKATVEGLTVRVEGLTTWRTRLEGIAEGTVTSVRYVALPVIVFLLYLLYHLVVVKVFPGLRI